MPPADRNHASSPDSVGTESQLCARRRIAGEIFLHTRIERLQAARRGNRYRADYSAARKCVLALTISWPCTAALAGPTGGQITAGSGTISQSGNTTTVTQSSANLD